MLIFDSECLRFDPMFFASVPHQRDQTICTDVIAGGCGTTFRNGITPSSEYLMVPDEGQRLRVRNTHTFLGKPKFHSQVRYFMESMVYN